MLIFIVQAHEGEMADMRLINGCTLELYCKTGNEAIKRAKKLIEKKHYRISQIIEKKE